MSHNSASADQLTPAFMLGYTASTSFSWRYSCRLIILPRIIPQAVCVRYGLSIGATFAPLVLAFMYVFAPIAWPIAKLLDNVLGANEQHTYKKAELKSFLQFHRTGEEPLRDDEIAILNGVLELNNKKVDQIMTPLRVSPLPYLP